MVPELNDTILGILSDNINKRCYIKKGSLVKHFIITPRLVEGLDYLNLINDYYWIEAIYKAANKSRDSWVKIKERNLWNKTITIIIHNNYSVIKQGKNEFKITKTISDRFYNQ